MPRASHGPEDARPLTAQRKTHLRAFADRQIVQLVERVAQSDRLPQRLGVHLGYLEQGGAHSASLQRLLEMAPGGAQPTPAQLVALLRLARFLRRELPTDDLKPLLDTILAAGSRR